MPAVQTIRVAVNGYGVIGKRVAAAVTRQDDMSLVGVSDVVTDWRAKMVIRNGFRLFGAAADTASAKQYINLSGYQWFVYSTMPGIFKDATIVSSGPLTFCPGGSVSVWVDKALLPRLEV